MRNSPGGRLDPNQLRTTKLTIDSLHNKNNLMNLHQHHICRLMALIVLLFSLTACASRLKQVSRAPETINITGSWKLLSQDQNSYERFNRQARMASAKATAELIERGESRSAIIEAQPNRMLLDVLISLLSLPREELFFRQTSGTIAID